MKALIVVLFLIGFATALPAIQAPTKSEQPAEAATATTKTSTSDQYGASAQTQSSGAHMAAPSNEAKSKGESAPVINGVLVEAGNKKVFKKGQDPSEEFKELTLGDGLSVFLEVEKTRPHSMHSKAPKVGHKFHHAVRTSHHQTNKKMHSGGSTATIHLKTHDVAKISKHSNKKTGSPQYEGSD